MSETLRCKRLTEQLGVDVRVDMNLPHDIVRMLTPTLSRYLNLDLCKRTLYSSL